MRPGTRFWFKDYIGIFCFIISHKFCFIPEAGTAGFMDNFTEDVTHVSKNQLRFIVFCCCEWETAWAILFYSLDPNNEKLPTNQPRLTKNNHQDCN